MKKTILTALLVGSLALSGLADEALRLSKEEAKQLHALLLVGELQDFGARARNPSAYLMAAELLLDYPSRDQNRARIAELCGRARELDRDDELVQAWADRLESRLKKSSRGPLSAFEEHLGELEPGETVELPGTYRGAWLHGQGLRMEFLDTRGRNLADSSNATLIRVSNETSTTKAYQLVILLPLDQPLD